MSEFDINPETIEPDNKISLGEASVESPIISAETADSRAYKIKFGLDGIVTKTKEELYGDLVSGKEGDMRTSVASEMDFRKRKATEEAISTYAQNKQGPLTPEEVTGIRSIIQNMSAKTDPSSVFEEAYAKQFLATLDNYSNKNDDNVLKEAKKFNPEMVAAMQAEASQVLVKGEFARTMYEDLRDEVKNQSWVGWGADQAKSVIPFYTQSKLRGNAPGTGMFTGGPLLGSNLEEQRKQLLRLPVDEYKVKLKEVVDNLRKDNPSVAAEFVQSIIGMSSDDIVMANITSLGDLASIPAAGLAKTGSRAVKDASQAIKQMVKASGEVPSKSTVLEASGDLKEAAIARATTNLVTDVEGTSDMTKRAVEALKSTFRVDMEDIKRAPGSMSQEIVNRIEASNTNVLNKLFDTLVNSQKVERLPAVMASETAVRAVQESIKDSMPGLRNAILDVSKPIPDKVSNTYFMDLYVGNNKGEYFKSREVAENFIKYQGWKSASIEEGTSVKFTKDFKRKQLVEKQIKDIEYALERRAEDVNNPKLTDAQKAKAQEQLELLPEGLAKYRAELDAINQKTGATASVEQQGLGYYVKITKPIRETDDAVRDFLVTTPETKMPDSYLNQFLGGLRTPEELLSKADRQNRLVATYGPSKYIEVVKENLKEIKALQDNKTSKGRQKWEDWNRIVKSGQDIIDPASKDKVPGYFFKSPAELESQYMLTLKRMPDAQEVAAYFEFKRQMEIDRAFRNIMLHKYKSRVGAETHKAYYLDEAGKRVESPDFDGVLKKEFPGGSTENILVVDANGTKVIKEIGRIDTKTVKEFREDVQTGRYKVVEIYDTESRPLRQFAESSDRIRYVMTPNLETKNLQWNHVPRRGGGHIEYDSDWYIKQAKMSSDDVGGKWWYEGDTTIMPIMLQSMGKNIAKHLDNVRLLLKDKKIDEARAYSNKELHIDWDIVSDWFTTKRTDTSFSPARLSLHEPITVVPKGKSTIDLPESGIEKRYANFKDGTKTGSLARQFQVQYTDARDAYEVFTMKDVGTKNSPLYQIEKARTVDPLSTLNRSLTNIVRSNFMDDYKIMGVEHWLRNAAKNIDALDSELRYSPFYYFSNNNLKWKKGVSLGVQRELEASRAAIEQLVGTPSTTDILAHSAAQKLADSIYGAVGPKAMALEPLWKLSKVRDPVSFVRSVTFTMKMGLFNVPQFIVQGANYANILGIAGYKNATPGTLGAQLHYWTTINKSQPILDHLDNLATKFNLPGSNKWKPGELKESIQEMEKTGFGLVGGEYAALDNMFNNKVITSKKDDFIEWGNIFFKEGERNAKYGAWHTAYKEFREKNPFGRITDADRAEILQRADILNINMSRASNSSLHSGVLSIPMQFYTYQTRLIELMSGKRISTMEKARLIATNATLYGLPMSIGLTGLPGADYIRKYALDNGYVVGDDFSESLFMEGIPSAIGAMITGGGDPKTGTWFDFGARYGTKGYDFILSSMKTDKTMFDIFGGASYSTIKNTWKNTDGLRTVIADLFSTEKTETFPIVIEDVLDVFREVSSVNTTLRTIAAFQTSKWMTKNDASITDISKTEAVFSALTGLKDNNINDLYTKQWSLNDQKEWEKEIQKQFLQEWRRAIVAQKDNPEQAKRFFTRAKAILEISGIREDKISDYLQMAVKDNQDLLEKTDFNYYLKQAPKDKTETRLKAYKKILEMKDNK